MRAAYLPLRLFLREEIFFFAAIFFVCFTVVAFRVFFGAASAFVEGKAIAIARRTKPSQKGMRGMRLFIIASLVKKSPSGKRFVKRLVLGIRRLSGRRMNVCVICRKRKFIRLVVLPRLFHGFKDKPAGTFRAETDNGRPC